ncbi:dual OB domain-containing protein [Nonlabens ulvanivorans]|uniref:dual OB domain-containing protein n=1 Tax=Nonlabens ulvanivorans TaxID=906888 RepID=UPI0037C7C7AF
MDILITSKTHKGNAACVGGLILNTNRFVRLLNPGNWDQYADTNLDIGDVWDIQFYDREEVEAPHIEDIIIQSKEYKKEISNLTNFIKTCGVTIYNGAPTQIFGGRLGWTRNGSGYIGNRDNLPANSVGFWISDRDLTLDEDNKHYNYPTTNQYERPKRFPYVGFEPKVQIIPSGTLMRISLARWWKPEDSDMNERCYLQLSGWYDLPQPKQPKNYIEEDDDLPF